MPKGNMPKRKPTAAQTSGRGSGRTTAASRARSARGSEFAILTDRGGSKGNYYADYQEYRIINPGTSRQSSRKIGKPKRVYSSSGASLALSAPPRKRKNTGSR